MSQLTLTLLRVGFLAVLWLFVLAAVGAMRSDIFGTRRPAGLPGRLQGRQSRPARPATSTPKPPRRRRGGPQRLVVTAGTLTGTSVRLGENQVTLGRAPDSTLVLDDDYASSRHARLYPHEGQWVVEDLGSTNGTYLDRTKLTGPTIVAVGTPIRIGKTVLELRR